MLQALQGRHAGQKFPVVQAIAKLSDAHGNDYCAEVNEALYDNNNYQTESLSSVHHKRVENQALQYLQKICSTISPILKIFYRESTYIYIYMLKFYQGN